MRNKMNAVKKSMLALGLGLGLSSAVMAGGVSLSACEAADDACMAGNQSACGFVARFCGDVTPTTEHGS